MIVADATAIALRARSERGSRRRRIVWRSVSGIGMAPLNRRGTWAALKELRAGLRKLRPETAPKVIFVDALDSEGRAVSLDDPDVAALVLGYRLSPS